MDQVKVTGHLIGNMGFSMVLDGHHTLITDASEAIGGNDQGPRPKQLLLSGLIGCTGIDIMSILKTMRITIEDLTIDAITTHTDEHPKVYENIHLIFKFKGDESVPIERLKRAVQLSQEKYCGVSAMLAKATPITYEVILEH
ncbi:MAG: OsmC family protein [Tissierellia bacterium]|nr:OsmC family protein [Tissierellia bacterium]